MAASTAHATAPSTTLRPPVLAGSALLSGFGIFSTLTFIVTGDWVWFLAGVPTAIVGGFLLFHRGTGADAS